ncbi:hypothetical protein [Cytophaga hutchinsonii]|uniref:hypothetical protein n=1 Tax=Cytophaga hutchinsonii TaxID=985 RepID=UPI000921F684|nr:hypothetical protein [Cytophaga hutchinsonii]SFX74759.1 hypothetical protein SAMN04487930_10919 [Cytophaga hutchinsonii ATCC 33406]
MPIKLSELNRLLMSFKYMCVYDLLAYGEKLDTGKFKKLLDERIRDNGTSEEYYQVDG